MEKDYKDSRLEDADTTDIGTSFPDQPVTVASLYQWFVGVCSKIIFSECYKKVCVKFED